MDFAVQHHHYHIRRKAGMAIPMATDWYKIIQVEPVWSVYNI